jgi:ComEC/Rec2-related protein
MQRPSLAPALLFALGIGFDLWVGGALTWILTGCGAVLAIAALSRAGKEVWLAASIVLSGWLAHALQRTPYAPTDLRVLIGSKPELVSVLGSIDDTPTLRVTERHGELRARTMVPIRVKALQREGKWEAATGTLMASHRGVLGAAFFRGQQVVVSGAIGVPPGPAAEHLFDYRNYLGHQGIWYTLNTEHPDDWRVGPEARSNPPLSERFLPWAQGVLMRGLPDDEITRLIVAMALGWKTPLTGEIDEAFMKSGTLHVFAISGLHIGLIAWILVQILRLMRLSRRWCGIVAAPLIWFYVAATGWQPSAVRSAIMSSVVLAGWILNRPGDLLNSLALSGWIILAWDPGQLFQASFQLSFGAVAGLALLGPPIEQRLVGWIRLPRDPFLPVELEPKWRTMVNLPLGWVAESLAVGLAATLSSLPLTIHWFHLVNPVSLLANLLVVPLSGFVLMDNFASVLSFWVHPWLAEVFNASGWLWMKGMVSFSRWCAALPAGNWSVEPPPWGWWIAYYLTLIGVASGGLAKGRWRLAGSLAVTLTVLAAVATWIRHVRELKITVLEGDAVAIHAGWNPGEQLLDCGNEQSVRRLVIPFLQAHGVNRLPLLIATRQDKRHLDGITNLLEEIPPRQVAAGTNTSRAVGIRSVLELAKQRGIPVERVARGQKVGGWEVLHPQAGDSFGSDEDQSVVLSGEFRGIRVVWLGNLGRPGQKALLERGVPQADIVVTGVPVGSEPLGSPLLQAFRPKLVVAAGEHYPASARLKPTTRERLLQTGIPFWNTESEGSVTLRFRNDGCEVSAMSGRTMEIRREAESR